MVIDTYCFVNTLQEKQSCPGSDECNNHLAAMSQHQGHGYVKKFIEISSDTKVQRNTKHDQMNKRQPDKFNC